MADSTYGLQRETPDWIRGRVFSADWGFVTLTMAISSIGAGIASDRFGPTAATVGIASLAILWGLVWGALDVASVAMTSASRASPLRVSPFDPHDPRHCVFGMAMRSRSGRRNCTHRV